MQPEVLLNLVSMAVVRWHRILGRIAFLLTKHCKLSQEHVPSLHRSNICAWI